MIVSRRNLLKLGAATGLSVAGSGVLWAADDTTNLRCETISLSYPDLPRAFSPYRIGFISDVHLGAFVSDDLVALAVDHCRRAAVDMLLLGGDYLWVDDGKLAQFYPLVRNQQFAKFRDRSLPSRIFSRLAMLCSSYSPPDGTFAVYGNHDKWMGPGECVRAFSERGIRFLNNQGAAITRGTSTLSVYGPDDFWTGRPRPPSAFGAEQFQVLLCHNPDYVVDLLASRRAHFHLAVCGHTHAGQIVLPGLGAIKYNVDNLRFSKGLVTLNERCHVYTTRGLGVVSVPYRMNCPPEVTIFELSAA